MLTKEEAAENVLVRTEAQELLQLTKQAFQYRKNQTESKNAIKAFKTVHPAKNPKRTVELYWKPDLLNTEDYTPLQKEYAAEHVLLRAEAEELLNIPSSQFQRYINRIPALKEVKPEGNAKRSTKLYWKADIEQFKQAKDFYRSTKD